MKKILLLSHFSEWHLASQNRFFQYIPYFNIKKIKSYLDRFVKEKLQYFNFIY